MDNKRRRFVGGNWKSNNTLAQSLALVENVVHKLNAEHVDIVVAPVTLHIPAVQQAIKNGVHVAVQNLGVQKFGAYTGEVSYLHLQDLGIKWAILGHSERRHTKEIHETDEYIAQKASVAVSNGIGVIYCIGETLTEMEEGHTQAVIERQLHALLAQVKDLTNVVIAYEPVWAIGTGKTATPEYAEKVHASIRALLPDQGVRIIYGGSVTKDNAAVLIGQPNIDGFLVGGASLKEDFVQIVAAVQ
ncbi:hypothetical protein pb186bvf_007142 [Paramecium bursaria]